MRFDKKLLLIAAVLFVSGCATNWVPDRWLASPEQSQVQGYGGWVTVTFNSPPRPPAGGELISVASDQLIILTPSGPVGVSKDGAKRVVVDGYEQDVRPIRRGWLAGSLSSITHGYFAAITVSLWTAAAQAALRQAYSYARVTYPGQPWPDLRRYARFPQGLPPGLDVHTLQAKPVPPPPPAAKK